MKPPPPGQTPIRIALSESKGAVPGGIHLNEAGNKLVADTVLSVIDK